MKLSDFQTEVHRLAKEKGWYDGAVMDAHTVLSKLALVHSEVSEATEAVRSGSLSLRSSNGKPEGVAAELADVVIRCLDLAEWLGLDLEDAIERKHEYNKTRPHRHGGKLA